MQTIALVLLATVLYSLQQQHLYRSSAQVLLSNVNLPNLIAGGTTGYQSPERAAETQSELARVPEVANRALTAAGIRGRAPDDLIAHSSVTPAANADLLNFSVTDPVPAVAARLATAYARVFTVYKSQLDTKTLQQARKGVEAQLKQLRALGNTNSAYYRDLQSRAQQLSTMAALLTPNFLVRTGGTAVQVQPRPVRYGVLGFVLGVGMGIALAFLREALDTRLRSAEEIGDRLGLPLLARLPEPPARLRNEGKLSMLEEPESVHAEAFRVLRTNLEFVNLERRAQIIMVTSGLEAEGKSTTVANLSVAFARGGRRVIAVDLDLRRPLLDKLLGLGKRPGLTQVALGQVPLEDALISLGVSGVRGRSGLDLATNGKEDIGGILEILPAGPLPPDVGEFVGSRVLTEIFEQLRHMADIIFVDSPPLLRVGDAITLSGKVDAMVLACNLAHTRRPMLNELRRVLDNCPADKLGFVLTGAQLESGYGYGGYGYGYGYYPRAAGAREREAVS